MPLQKQPLAINFAQGLDTKTDPWQVSPGKFLALQNSIFTKGGLLQKRNGFGLLSSLPITNSTFLSTFNGSLAAIGSSLQAYVASSKTWITKGNLKSIGLAVTPVVRSNTNQEQADSAVASNGLVCTAYIDDLTGGATVTYSVIDSASGQSIVPGTVITSPGATISGPPRTFILGNFFVIVFTATISATPHLQYIAIGITNPLVVTAPADISTVYTPNSDGDFDGIVANNSLYLAWNASDLTGIHATYIDAFLTQHDVITVAGHAATNMSLCADLAPSTPNIYITQYDGAGNTYTMAVNSQLLSVFTYQTVATGITLDNLTSIANNGVCTVFGEVDNNYTYNLAIPTHYISSITITGTTSPVVGSPVLVARSVGLASKAFAVAGVTYILTTYQSPYQPTYFLMDGTGNIIGKLAYSNGGGYCTDGLPSVTVIGSLAYIPYLLTDSIQAAAKSITGSSPPIYTQRGVNLATFNFTPTQTSVAEIAQSLQLSGGILWQYDGYTPVEHGFNLWPDSVKATQATTSGGAMATTSSPYFYQVTYEWTDNQGLLHRSAPSVPVSVTVSGGNNSVTLNIPTLRLTYKIAKPVKIVIYRQSTTQQVFYRTTSITVPLLNNTAVDYVTYPDINSDAQILGNDIIYTTGGVIENIGAPASTNVSLFNNRLWLLDAEDTNLLWFSKQVIEAVPVEMSDLLTMYVAPTTSAQGSTGPTLAMSPLDDKLILFKKDAIYYINGTGPDNTGSNSQYSDAIFISSTVGSNNQRSIVFIPAGLVFQSDKGIWLLGRDLSTTYIGAPVEGLTQGATVLSALTVPGTNQVRFNLDSGITLMYDYFYGQWGVFSNISAISSTLYEGLHTFVDEFGRVLQETPGVYLDAASPVLMSFTTSWINLAGVQGFERFYEALLLGQYMTPFNLNVQFAFNYNPSPIQATLVTQVNSTPAWGSSFVWGDIPEWGGPGNVFSARVFPNKQKCESFQVTVTEVFDPTKGVPAGAGLTLSGLSLLVGMKRGHRTQSAARSFG